jgi:hypothetical protein
MAKHGVTISWLDQPQAHDYPAAFSYLSLIFEPKVARAYVARLRKASLTQFAAKDIFRASGLPLLGISNVRVKRDQGKIKAGEALSPLLLVRDKAQSKVIVADGYHRLCAVYSYDETAMISCKIV